MTQQSNDLPNKERLSDAKRALLEKRLRGQVQGHNRVESISVYKGTDPIPLSFGQERLFFLHQLNPQSPAYNMYDAVRIQGRLDKSILTETFKFLIRRHPAFRTSFVVEGDRPWQKVAPEADFEIPELELQSGSTADGECSVLELIKTEICRPFDLAKSPLLRALLIRQAKEDHILVVTVHHIIFDEWSNELFWREFSMIYHALSVGQLPALSELSVQYTDFTLWQKHQLETRMADQLAYWRQKLGGELPLIQLPTDRPRPAQQTFRGTLKWRQLPVPLGQKLASLNQELGTTMFMTLLAAFQLLLARYTSQSDVLIGTPIANRSRPETKGLIGLFLNTLVLRADVSEDMPFAEFAARTRKASLEAFTHQDLPFEKLVDELHPQRDKSHNPIFQVMFVHQKSALEELHLPGLVTSPVSLDGGVAKFDLTLFVQESNGALRVGLEYNTDLFDHGTADRILEHYQTLLESVVQNPRHPISALQILPDDERKKLLYEWNDTATDPIPDICIHQRIEEHIAQKPEGLAVADDTGRLSYQELNKRANQLARYLRRLDVGPNVPVGLLLERSTDMIVSILAVLKAGGAYVPLDPDYPAERLSFMLTNARVPVVLTQSKLSGVLPDHKAHICFLDRDADLIAEESSTDLESTANPDNLAYIIYTSGSTGQPRGVPVSHRNLVHSTLAREYFYEDRVGSFLLLSSFTFDSSVAGIFWTLCQGGKLVLPPQRIEQDMSRLSEIIALHGITHTLCLPSLHMLLLEIAEPAKLSSLKAVIVAGEACPLELVRQHYRRLPYADLYNEYGPTEGTVWSTACKIPVDFDGDRVPIGRPIPNMQNYILDRYDQPVPIGVPGELCIAGPGTTAGYLNAPDKTAQKFIQISFDKEPPRRLYRTGDRARYLPDGNIDFLGRMDHQVKIRGNRVELGEIENVLRRSAGVKDAIVDLQDGNLIAYIVPDSSTVSVPEWRTWLASSLPAYMIPTTFLTMEDFPRTPNGKIDRKALPLPGTHGRNDAIVEPRSEAEQALKEIWKSVLGVDNIGIHDNFFDIGGNSILSIRIFARIAEKFNVHLPLSALFTETTIEKLAARITEQKETNKSWPVLVPIQINGSKPPFFAVHGIGGGVGYRDLSNSLGNDQPLFGLQAVGQDGQEAFDVSIEAMASRYIRAMRSQQPHGPYRIGGYCFGGLIAYEMACQLEEMGEQVSTLAIFEGTLAHEVDTSVPFSHRLHAFRQNLLAWIRDYASMPSHQLFTRIRSTFAKVLMKFQRNPELDRRVRVEETLGIDAQHIPQKNKELLDIHMQAALDYAPNPYNGRVTLFRARTRSFNEVVFGSLDPQMGWGELARGGVQVHLVDGFHRNMHLAPYVSSLAAELKKCLDHEIYD